MFQKILSEIKISEPWDKCPLRLKKISFFKSYLIFPAFPEKQEQKSKGNIKENQYSLGDAQILLLKTEPTEWFQKYVQYEIFKAISSEKYFFLSSQRNILDYFSTLCGKKRPLKSTFLPYRVKSLFYTQNGHF